MKETCKCALKEYLSTCLHDARVSAHMTQETFAAYLLMSPRAYIALEHGEFLCCTFAFILYMTFICDDVSSLRDDLEAVILKAVQSKGYDYKSSQHPSHAGIQR